MNDIITLQNELALSRYNRKKYIAFLNGEVIEENPILERLLDNRNKKVNRIKKRITILSARYKKYVYFCTFTFDDDLLKKSHRTRKRAILNALYSFDKDIMFLMNPDFGKKNHRLHFHAIIGTNFNQDLRKHLKLYYPCLSSCDRVYFDSKRHLTQVSKYINKLSNHATKDTSRAYRVICNFSSYEKLESQRDRIFYYLEDINFLYGVRS